MSIIAIVTTSLLATVSMSRATYPPGCFEPTHPDAMECERMNWYLGPDAKDSCAPVGPYPVSGQQVYIQDAVNFCLNLPDPQSPWLLSMVYAGGRLPNFLQGEGFLQSYCMGSYLAPGALPLPAGGIRSAHVIKGVSLGGKSYIQISGTMDCEALGMNCTASFPGAYDDGGQYDNVPFINCGKAPYSGVDASAHPGMIDYAEQGGNGIFCMRICEVGSQIGDPCNVKNDTAGCFATMGITTFGVPGFDTFDRATGQTITHSVSLPPLKSSTTTTTETQSSASSATSIAKNGAHSNTADVFRIAGSFTAGLVALFLQ